MFELKDIVNNVLLFRALSATAANILSLDNDLYTLYENSEDKDCLTNDKIFMLAKERNAITHDDFEYNMMFAIGLTELGPEYNGRREDEEEIEQ